MVHKWTKICIEVYEHLMMFDISENGTLVRTEHHTDKSEMEYSIIDWIRHYIPEWWFEHVEFEILRYR